jgi:hypothetical protein
MPRRPDKEIEDEIIRLENQIDGIRSNVFKRNKYMIEKQTISEMRIRIGELQWTMSKE